jgi:predicted alpha/beta hydrolase family esterase
MTRYLIIPGWAGSGPDHWQSHWERDLANASRVEMPDWLEPRRADWLGTLDRVVRSLTEPPILIAHSLGCLAVAHWAALSTHHVRGALLVAPADLDRERCPAFLREFAPVPHARLRFPTRVVASDDDPYATLTRVRQIASDWGSDLTVIEGAGHINSESGYGRWPEGRTLLRRFDEDSHDDESRSSGRQGYELDGDDPPWICRGVD